MKFFENYGATGATISAIVALIAGKIGKIPILLLLFFVAVCIDYLTGWVKAALILREWNSKTGLKGVVKKVMYFVLIGVAFLAGNSIEQIIAQVGYNLEIGINIGWYIVAVMLINELTSIIENLYIIIPDKVPSWLVKILKIADDTLENKINDLVCKNQDCKECGIKDRCNHYNEKK